MRRRGHRPWASFADSGSSRPTILLTTEGDSPTSAGGLGNWCDAIVGGMPEFDFVVWSLFAHARTEPASTMPPNVIRWIDLQLSDADGPQVSDHRHADRASGGNPAWVRRPPPAEDAEQEFAPLLKAFLDTTVDPAASGTRLATALLGLRDHFRKWDYALTWRSPTARDVLHDHMLGRASRPTTPVSPMAPVSPLSPVSPVARRAASGAERPDGDPEAPPTVDEAARAVEWLGGMLSPLALEVPVTDLVHVTGPGACALPGIVARAERGTPLLLTVLGAPLEHHMEAAGPSIHLRRVVAEVTGALARTCSRLADRIVRDSRGRGRRWEGQEAREALGAVVDVAPVGVDEEIFRPLRVPRSERPTVVQVARIAPVEDQATLLRVADRVRREVPDVLFLHYGEIADPAYWEELQRLRDDLTLEGTIRFEGPTADVPTALAQADVALGTPRGGEFPLSLVEALMCGLPLVATSADGVRDALEGAALMAPPGNHVALADAVAATLRISPEQRAAIGRAAREWALSRFRLGRFLDDHRRLYRELVEGAPREAQPGAETAPAGGVDRPTDGAGAAPAGVFVESTDLRGQLANADPFVRMTALGRLEGTEGTELAGVALADEYPQVRREAVRAIGRLDGPRAARWLGEILSHDPSAEVREEAVMALASLLARWPAQEGG
jgi:glycosyltransferase involved in cell wall biosynthesis